MNKITFEQKEEVEEEEYQMKKLKTDIGSMNKSIKEMKACIDKLPKLLMDYFSLKRNKYLVKGFSIRVKGISNFNGSSNESRSFSSDEPKRRKKI